LSVLSAALLLVASAAACGASGVKDSDLTVGSCYTTADHDFTAYRSVASCGKRHDVEVYAKGAIPAGFTCGHGWPHDSFRDCLYEQKRNLTIGDLLRRQCDAALKAHLGMNYVETKYVKVQPVVIDNSTVDYGFQAEADPSPYPRALPYICQVDEDGASVPLVQFYRDFREGLTQLGMTTPSPR
jgi:hypothetical protein